MSASDRFQVISPDQVTASGVATLSERYTVISGQSQVEPAVITERMRDFEVDPNLVAIVLTAPETPSLHRAREILPHSLGALVVEPLEEDVLLVPTNHLQSAIAEVDAGGGDRSWRILAALSAGGMVSWVERAGIAPAGRDLPALAPGAPGRERHWLRHLIEQRVEALRPGAASPVNCTAVAAGLLQIHDWLDRSHEYSQSIEGQGRHSDGDYWHAIMHRREPDYSNAKYWFRRVGRHPIQDALGQIASEILQECDDASAAEWAGRLTQGGWDSFAFVDLCQSCARDGETPLAMAARRIQREEMFLLLSQTAQDAFEHFG